VKLGDCHLEPVDRTNVVEKRTKPWAPGERLYFVIQADFDESDRGPIRIAINDDGRDRWVGFFPVDDPKGKGMSLLVELDELSEGQHPLRVIVDGKRTGIVLTAHVARP
jgi:hypothetical protein